MGLSQQLLKTHSLQFTTNYIHDNNHTTKCINLNKDVYLRPSNPQLTPPTLQIQYCYSYSDEILPTCTH